jgi:hypothetical protein
MKLFPVQLGLLCCTGILAVSGAFAQTVAQVSPSGNNAAPNMLDPGFKPKANSVNVPSAPNVSTEGVPQDVQAAFEAGAYSKASKLGAAALVSQPSNSSLRLLVANSLSWSGRLDAAFEQYEKLLTGPASAAAKVGQANILRWRGKPEQAELLYNAVLKTDPNNADAKDGRRLGERELRGQWIKTLSYGKDSSNFRRLESTTGYKSYTEDRSIRWGAGYILGKDIGAPAASKYAEINGNVQWLNLPLKPKVDLSVADGFNKTRLYGLVAAQMVDDNISLRAGYVNWGRKAFNTAAQQAHLAARQMGASAQWQFELGELRLRGDYYSIADKNRVWDYEATLNPAWQPLPFDLRWYAGAYNKQAKRADARYWSPASAYTLGLLGLKKAWYFERGDLSVGFQSGLKLSDEAKNNFGLSASGKWWLTDSTALGLDFWSSNSPRQTDYKQNFLTLNLQRLW